jgi:transcriptional regulator with XRE-family HTH domain
MATSVPIAPSLQIGERLAKERLRLGMTQSEFSGVIGLSRNSVTQYEAGNHQPGAEALVGMHAAGADVLYILTGLRAESRKIDLDLDRMAIALQEARRQMALPADTVGQREILDRAWVVYLALGSVLNANLVVDHKASTQAKSQVL